MKNRIPTLEQFISESSENEYYLVYSKKNNTEIAIDGPMTLDLANKGKRACSNFAKYCKIFDDVSKAEEQKKQWETIIKNK